MKTLLEYITFVKGIEYLIVVAFCFAFIALWILVHSKEKIGMTGVVSVVVPLSLIFGCAAIVVASNGSAEGTVASTVPETVTPGDHINTSLPAVTATSQDKWLRVNESEYLSIKYGPATKFHQIMSNKVSCVTCHHNSGDEIHACKDCHDRPFNPHESNMPGLKAAYHQRCMECHKEDFADGPKSCVKCHTGETANSTVVSAPDRPHGLTWETCSKCHKDGIPNGGGDSKIVYHDSCLKCHAKGIGGANIVPADHAGRGSNTCSGCHKPAGG